MAVRSLGTQEMGEGFECLKEQNCDPPPPSPRGPPPPLVPRAKGTKEIERRLLRVGEEGCLLGASA